MGFEDTFKALSDPTRRQILQMLRSGRKSAGEIGEQIGLTGATISHHLNVLKGAGLVSDEREGKYIYYTLDTSVVEDLMAWLMQLRGGNDDEA